MITEWLTKALESCAYIEDVRALHHFVFHPRYNGASNTCLLCGNPADIDPEEDPEGDWARGHTADCLWPKTLLAHENHSLAYWVERA